jgi:peptidoglycan/LPS O-acetylase OafA/YrhL
LSADATPTLDRPTKAGHGGYIATLDGWRAVAIGLVIAGHCIPMLRNSGIGFAQYPIALFGHAGYGVDIFFALSGFLISSLLLREKARAGQIDLKNFYIRRFFRIMPPMALFLACLAALAVAEPQLHVTGRELLASLLFARNYTEGSWYTGHFWSLSIEEHFYAVIPMLVLLLGPKALLRTCLGLIVICVVARAFELSHGDWFQPLPQFRTENRVDALLWGSVLAQLYNDPRQVQRLRTLLRPRTALIWLVLVAALLLAFDIQAVRRTVVAVGLPPLILHTILHPACLAGRLLELRAIKFVGRISYSLYVWQMLFLVPADRPLGIVQAFPLAVLLPLGVAYASYIFIEGPMIGLGHRLTGRWRVQTAVA